MLGGSTSGGSISCTDAHEWHLAMSIENGTRVSFCSLVRGNLACGRAVCIRRRRCRIPWREKAAYCMWCRISGMHGVLCCVGGGDGGNSARGVSVQLRREGFVFVVFYA